MTQRQMPSMPEHPPAPTTPSRARRGWLKPAAFTLAGAIIGAGTIGGLWYTTGDKNNHGHTAAAAAGTAKTVADNDTFTLEGTLTLTEGAGDDGIGGCEGTGGYSDISTGTAVTVYNAAGSVIATGALGGATSGETSLSCIFTVLVDDVPEGEKFYQVEVSHRGKITVSANDARAGLMAATLGS